MKDHFEQSSQTVDLMAIADDELADLAGEQQAAVTRECDHCGHCPCGCGG